MIIFCDVETGGLDPTKHCLLEVCFIPVDDNFNLKGEFRRTISWDGQDGKIIDEFCTKMHTKNNLIEECRPSVSISSIDTQLRQWLETYNEIILGGSSVHFDRKFLIHYFPWIEKKLHYRMLDVRSLNLTYDLSLNLPCPKDSHRAGPDCINAIYTAQQYRNKLASDLHKP